MPTNHTSETPSFTIHLHWNMEISYIYLPFIILALYIFTNHFLHKFHNLPPSPFPCLPFIGHLYLLKPPFHKSLFKVSKKYGPLIYLRLGSIPVLVVSSPSIVEECLSKNDVTFANRPLFLFGKYFGYNYTSLAWSSYGVHWRNLRRISSLEVLSSQRIQLLSYIRDEEVGNLVFKLFQDCGKNPNKFLDMKSNLFEFTYNIMTRMIMGKIYFGENVDNAKEARDFQHIIEETASMKNKAFVLDFLPFLRWFGLKNVEEKLRNIQEKRDGFMQNLIEEYRGMKNNEGFYDNSDEGKGKTIIEVLLDLHEKEPEYYTDEFIRNLMLVLLQAGSDTSANTLNMAVTLLLENPHVFKKARSDIDNLVGQERMVNESDLSKLPYIRYIINETLRMHPPAPLLMPHRSSQECNVGGYRIPKETVLWVNAWGMHHDDKVWEEPETFKPERFHGFEEGKDGFKLMAFGSGRRGCPGENLAHRVIGLALGSLIQCFDWETEMLEGNVAVGAKVKPLMARCYPRSNTAKLIAKMQKKN